MLLEEFEQLRAPNAPAQHNLSSAIHAMRLKNRLREV
jgi:hypothetical protein